MTSDRPRRTAPVLFTRTAPRTRPESGIRACIDGPFQKRNQGLHPGSDWYYGSQDLAPVFKHELRLCK